MQKSRRGNPTQERWINELSEEDVKKRIRVLGVIIEFNSEEDYVILDDGTGQIHIQSDKPISFTTGNQIRVFGILRNLNVIDAEIIQDMEKLDIELFKRVQAIKKRFKEKS